MADQHHAAAQPLDEVLQRGQAGEVQVVGGLVQQHHVEAAQQQGGQGHPGGLAAGKSGHQRVGTQLPARGPPAQPGCGHPGPRRRRPSSGRRPGSRHHLPRARRSPGLRRWFPSAGWLRRSRSGGQCNRPLVSPEMRSCSCGSQPTKASAGARLTRTVLGLVHTGEEAQQRGLPGAVRSHHPDDVAGGYCQRKPGEEHTVAVATGDVLGNEGCSH